VEIADQVTVRELSYFLAVAETLSFRRAAALTYVSQPSLSRQVRSLETRLGVDLFERNSRHVRLTQAGREMVSMASELLTQFEQALRLARRATSETENVVSCPEGSGQTVLFLATLRRSLPEIDVLSHEVWSTELADALQSGSASICIGPSMDELPTVASRLWNEDELVALVPPDCRWKPGRRISLSDLAGRPVTARGSREAPLLHQALAEKDCELEMTEMQPGLGYHYLASGIVLLTLRSCASLVPYGSLVVPIEDCGPVRFFASVRSGSPLETVLAGLPHR
jgi:DNA-binding transcriptional LysR family regulator